jgi:hypothetical protein
LSISLAEISFSRNLSPVFMSTLRGGKNGGSDAGAALGDWGIDRSFRLFVSPSHDHPISPLSKMNRLSLVSRPAASLLIARQGSAAANMMAIRRFSEDINPSRLFIGGLSWNTDDNKLREAFEGFGEVRHGTALHAFPLHCQFDLSTRAGDLICKPRARDGRPFA